MRTRVDRLRAADALVTGPELMRRRTTWLLFWAVASACTYGPEERRVVVEQVIRLGGSSRALVVVRHDAFRRPTGLNAFPDGGRWTFLDRRATVHLADAADRSLAVLARRAAPDLLWESFGAHVRALDGDSLAYLALTGCPRGGECYGDLVGTLLLRISVRGDVQEVDDVPDGAGLPGTMVARRPGEELYLRFGIRGDTVVVRDEEGGDFTPVWRALDDGSLVQIGG